MKNLKISYTVFPTGRVKLYTNGLPRPTRPINSIGFNIWALNTMKSVEGVCYEKALDEVLEEAKSLLTPRR